MQVKSIDDFFERFDLKENTAFQKYIKMSYPTFHFNRKDFIPTLFNKKNAALLPKEQLNFIESVTDTLHPQFINYDDKDWFAELTCSVLYYGKPKNLTLILKVQSTADKRYSWTIVSAKADFLKLKPTKADSVVLKNKDSCCASINMKKSKAYFLTPISHGIDFTNVDDVFANKTHINEYIYKGAGSFELCKLISLVKKSKIQFKYISTVSYHLLQIDGWIVKVDYFNRNDYNSGWLINNLIKAKDTDKENYRIKTLNLATY